MLKYFLRRGRRKGKLKTKELEKLPSSITIDKGPLLLLLALTEKLVIIGPYAYCRNPIVLGAMLYYLGIVLLVGGLSGIMIVF